ncbi:MAG: N-acetyltransferase family protein [Hyphomicrobiales bacterium]
MIIRILRRNDARKLITLKKTLDSETIFMMYEAGERKDCIIETENEIVTLNRNNSIILGCEIDTKLVGYLSGEKGEFNRNKHVLYITIGILKEYHGKNIGKKLFSELEKWAKNNSIKRLELSVIIYNERTIQLYKSVGFEIEGIRKESICYKKRFVSEYYMAKIL